MGPTESMLREHATIMGVLLAFEAEGRHVRTTGTRDPTRAAGFFRFFRGFADALHHAKEEELIFAHLASAGAGATAGIISQLRREHASLREQLDRLQTLANLPGTAENLQEYDALLRAYATLVRGHIRREDDFLLGATELLLDVETRTLLDAEFAAHGVTHDAELKEFLALGERLCREVGVQLPQTASTPTASERTPATVWPPETRPLRVAIVGAGPAGFFAASTLLNQPRIPVEVDIIERLPSPYGLVRAGVAPDRNNIKSVAEVFERTATRPLLSFFGNVELGRDVTADELRLLYDEVVYATGSELDRRLGIPGDGATGTTPATVLVGWYNAHPDFRDAAVCFDAEEVAIVGNGNVALDIARILLRDPAELRRTDMAEHALDLLSQSRIRRVHILGRRTIFDAAFGPHELRDLVTLPNLRTVVAPTELEPGLAGDASVVSSTARSNFELLSEASRRTTPGAPREVVFRFLVSPSAVLVDERHHARGLVLDKLERVHDMDGHAAYRASGATEELEVGWIYTAIGYQTRALPGVPYDAERGVIANDGGRVVDPDSRELREHEYCVGWAQNGAKGIIGTNKRAAHEVMTKLLTQVERQGPESRPERVGGLGLSTLLRHRGSHPVGFGEWKRIDATEVERGAARGAPRSKMARIDEMLAAAGLLKQG